jgi:hypothetical protein
VTSTCNFQFGLWDALSGGTQLGTTQTVPSVSVSNGLFTVTLNSGSEFGANAFIGEARWLATFVQCTGDGSYNPLSPRQPVSPAPFAFALPGLYTQQNTTSPNVIGGYVGNSVTGGAVGATIGGGGASGMVNQVSASYSTVAGGLSNTASGYQSAVSGGAINQATGPAATVGGGDSNTAGGNRGTIAGGNGNVASDLYASVGGGYHNTASSASTTVGGGYANTASNNAATVPGGANNEASGAYSFAAGADGHATHTGSFVWSSAERTDSWGVQTFTVRAHGGVRFYTASGTGTGVQLSSGGGSWSSLSDRAAKANVSPVDNRAILAQVAAIPVQTWNYKTQDPSIRHIGPMAQDFYAAFGVGEDDTHITTVDADGVALAAIQGLYQVVQERDAQVANLKSQVATLEARVAAMEQVAHAQSSPPVLPDGLSTPVWILVGLAGYAVFQRAQRGGAR